MRFAATECPDQIRWNDIAAQAVPPLPDWIGALSMKTEKALAVLTTTALITGFGAGIADAHGKWGDQGAMQTMVIERFEAMDQNKDGKVTQAEIFSSRKDEFAAADTNGDGALSVEEMAARHEKIRARMAERRLQFMDTDGDGAVSAEEFARARHPIMMRLDRDGDGAFSREEIDGMMERMKHKAHGRGWFSGWWGSKG